MLLVSQIKGATVVDNAVVVLVVGFPSGPIVVLIIIPCCGFVVVIVVSPPLGPIVVIVVGPPKTGVGSQTTLDT